MYSTTKSGTFVEAGACPASHPVRMPQLAYETIWDTTKFNDKSQWPADGSQPFVVRVSTLSDHDTILVLPC